MSPKAQAQLKAVAELVVMLLVAFCVMFATPLAWVLALLVVLFGVGSCAHDLFALPAMMCFAALVGLHLLVAFYPLERIERRFGSKRADRN